MDEHLNWKYQISSVAKKVSRGIGIIAKLRSFLHPMLLRNIYYCLVFSHLSYGVEAWGSARSTDLGNLLILQQKAVRILTGNKYFQIYGEPSTPLPSAEPLFKTLEILKFDEIFKFSIAKFIYSTLASESPAVFSEWFTYSHIIHNHATTSSTNINRAHYFDVGDVEHSRYLLTKRGHLVNYGAKMIQVYGPKLWNTLPKHIHDSNSLPTFKINAKKYFIEQYTDPVSVQNNSHNRISHNIPQRRNNSHHNNNQRQNQNSSSNHRLRLDNNNMINRPFVSRWDL